MDLEEKFNHEVENWRAYLETVRPTSFASSFIDCEPFRNIVDMGRDALPLVRQLYNSDTNGDFRLEIIQMHGLKAVVGGIVGEEDLSLPRELWGNLPKTADYCKNWLDKYLTQKN